MGLPLSLPWWRSTHELFHPSSLRRCAGHPVRVQWKGPHPQRLKSPSPMTANETIAHVPRVTFEEMSWNNVQRQENQSAQMVEQKDTHVEHSLPSPSRSIVQTQTHHRRTTSISLGLFEKSAAIIAISSSPSSSYKRFYSQLEQTLATHSEPTTLPKQDPRCSLC